MEPAGLTQLEAANRLERFGPNELPREHGPTLLERTKNQLRSPLIGLLLCALAIDLLAWLSAGRSGTPIELIAIAAILVLNAGLGVAQEFRADAALGKLDELTAPTVCVLRDSRLVRLSARDLVPGDVVKMEAGTRVPADGTLLQAANCSADESLLTGESLPLPKLKGERLLSGTLLVAGSATLQITQTGPASNLGKLAQSLGSIRTGSTPLEQKLEVFGRTVAKWVLVLAGLLVLLGIAVEGLGAFDRILLFSVALAVAAVPEGLPAILTLTLARGMERMARHNAVIRRMSAVEALGSVTVIGVDKTGTLTENRMTVKSVSSPNEREAVLTMILASEAEEGDETGDPLELALIAYVLNLGVSPSKVREEWKRESVRPFDSNSKYMRTTCTKGGRTTHFLKGAPEVLLEMSVLNEDDRRKWNEEMQHGARQGYRVLGLAKGDAHDGHPLDFLGLIFLWDPPRAEVRDALKRVRSAGIRVVMVTGDHPETAKAVAASVGLETERVMTGNELAELRHVPAGIHVFARVKPEEKLHLVELLQRQGEVVAMTGDGVNDAPAIKRADIGIAMGLRGSDVSREVADLVLLDDNFATIVHAVHHGRSIYANIQKFVRFLLSTNLAELAIILGGAVGSLIMDMRTGSGSLLLPLTAVQILWLNLVTDGPPALALGLDPNPKVMEELPRNPSTPLLDRASTSYILAAGCILASIGGGLLIFMSQQGWPHEVARTSLFYYMMLAQLACSVPVRGVRHRRRSNRALGAAIGLTLALQLIIAALPQARSALGLVPISFQALLLMLAGAGAAWALVEGYVHSRFSLGRMEGDERGKATRPA